MEAWMANWNNEGKLWELLDERWRARSCNRPLRWEREDADADAGMVALLGDVGLERERKE